MTDCKSLENGSTHTFPSMPLAASKVSHAYQPEAEATPTTIYCYAKRDQIYSIDNNLDLFDANTNIGLGGEMAYSSHDRMHQNKNRMFSSVCYYNKLGSIMVAAASVFVLIMA